MDVIQIAFGSSGLVFGAIVAWVVLSQVHKKELASEKRISSLEADSNDSSKIKSELATFKSSEEFQALKKLEFQNGFISGSAATLNDFQVQYQKFDSVDEKFFSSVVETGYFMQLTYKGLPIGDVTKRIVHAEKKVDKKRVDEIIAKLTATVDSLIGAAAASKIPVKEVAHLVAKG